MDRRSLDYSYEISYNLIRKHFNPPIFQDAHFHCFRVTLHLLAGRSPSDMYGIDMIEWEQRLKQWAELLPDVVNDQAGYELGTTEDLCLYFSKIPLDDHIRLFCVSVAETGDRITYLRFNQ